MKVLPILCMALCLFLITSCSKDESISTTAPLEFETTTETTDFTTTVELIDPSFCASGNRFTEMEIFNGNQIASRFDIQYGRALNWQGNMEDLLFDIYLPRRAADDLSLRPAIVLIHGGGFKSGNKAVLRTTCELFAKRGFVAITVGYRLGWDLSDPSDQQKAAYRANQDANAAMRFIVRNASQAGINTDQLFIGGSSAGAITALNVTYLDQAEWNAVVPGIETELGGLFTSGNNLTNTYTIQGVFNNWGATYRDAIQVDEMVPTISFHGALDNVVPINDDGTGFGGSIMINQLLTANGVCSELNVKPDGGHGIYKDASGTIFRVGRASCFFRSVLCNNCVSNVFLTRVEPDCSTDVPVN